MTPSRRGARLRLRLRLRDIPFLPLLLLLHIIFTLSSLLLRLYEALTDSSTLPPRTFVPPKHVALSLPASVPVTVTLTREQSRRRTEAAAALRRRKELELERAAVGSVLRVARWAVREGVETISVHEPSGVLYAAKDRLRSELSNAPPSPSLSASTEALNDLDPVESAETERLHEVQGDEEPGTVTPDSHGVFSITVFPHHTPTSLSDSIDTLHDGLRPLTLRILPPSSSDLVARITRDLVREGHKASSITQDVLNARIEAAGYTPPDILLIHPLTPQPFWRSLLPRPAPEIAGYPFWPLRVTEIYQHPPPLPLYPLTPLLSLARRSSLPLLRKLGNLLPIEDDRDAHVVSSHPGSTGEGTAPTTDDATSIVGAADGDEVIHEYPRERWEEESRGVLRREEWEGMMEAWCAVEQRLGR